MKNELRSCNDVQSAFNEVEQKLLAINDIAERHWEALRRLIINNYNITTEGFEFREL